MDRQGLKDILAQERNTSPNKDGTTMGPQVLSALCLPAHEPLADVRAAIHGSKMPELSLAKTREQLEAQASTQRATVIDAAITQLASTGKIKPGGEVEQSLRRIAGVGHAPGAPAR